MKVESKYNGIQKGFGEVVSLYHVICSYIAIVQLEGINGNRRQSSVFYLAPSLICGEGLLVNSRRSIFHIADPTKCMNKRNSVLRVLLTRIR